MLLSDSSSARGVYMSNMDPSQASERENLEQAMSQDRLRTKLGIPSQVKLVLTRFVSRDFGFLFLKCRCVLLLLRPVGVCACSS